ncbi:MAG: hypothetical protein AAGF92_13430 [Myxococcota bacterium]
MWRRTIAAALVASWVGVARADDPKPQAPSPYVAPEGDALLVFVRPRKRLAEDVLYSVVNARGECIGVLGNDWKVTAAIRPGTQTLMVVSGVAQPQVQLLQVQATKGHTYVVTMRPRVNRKSPVDLTVLRRRDQPLKAFPAAILDTNPFRSDLGDCTAWVAAKRERLTSKAEAAKEQWSVDPEVRSAQTVRANDGWPAKEVLP